MATVYLSLGSNVGDRKANLRRAIIFIWQIDGCNIEKESQVYETSPVGGPKQQDYFNQVIEISVGLSPYELLEQLLAFEDLLGRERSVENGPRTIDIDILFYDDVIIKKKDLILPHPRLHERLFVLYPLLDIAPDFVHPLYNKTVRELTESLETLQREQKAKKIE